jgi:hypothetical protein
MNTLTKLVFSIPASTCHVLGPLHASDRGDFWAQLVNILVFASPTGYMETTSGFALLSWVYSIDSFKMINNFHEVLNLNWLFLKLNRFIGT